jgi:hypothetical protein
MKTRKEEEEQTKMPKEHKFYFWVTVGHSSLKGSINSSEDFKFEIVRTFKYFHLQLQFGSVGIILK